MPKGRLSSRSKPAPLILGGAFLISTALSVWFNLLLQPSFYDYSTTAFVEPASPSAGREDPAIAPVIVSHTRIHHPHTQIQPLLVDLVNDDPKEECAEGLVRVPDSRRDLLLSASNSSSRFIPKVVHLTARSRCMPPVFRDNIEKWRFPDHTVLVHDDESVARLLQGHFAEFPEVQKAAHCLLSGAGKADLWRALILYEYGGIYADFDSAPGKEFRNGRIIEDTDEAFFVVEQSRILSQYFMAAAPHHPLLYLLVQKMIQRLYNLNQVNNQYVPRSTGPGALKYAFLSFMDDAGDNFFEGSRSDCNSKTSTTTADKNDRPRFDEVSSGIYTGWDNRTVRVVGNYKYPNLYIKRESIHKKKNWYKLMNMTDFEAVQRQKKEETDTTCFRRIYERDGWAARWGTTPT